MKIAVTGGGAAGFFAAISAKSHHPNAEVALYEATGKVLQKVKVSGGGRCNVAHSCFEISRLAASYPRGEKFLKKAFHQFSTPDTIAWFKKRKVKLKTEMDGRIFPITDSSQTIIDCLLGEFQKLKAELHLNHKIVRLQTHEQQFHLYFANGITAVADKVIVATGGSPKAGGLQWLQELGHAIELPVPSLFTFNMPKDPVTSLMGVVADPATVKIAGTKLSTTGALLITHWGMSGPVVLRLSAFGARVMHDKDYHFEVLVNWPGKPEHELRQLMEMEWATWDPRKISKQNPFFLPKRLWQFLLQKANIDMEKTWGALSKKEYNRIVNILTHDIYKAEGKTTFKEEFVTCGGVALQDISPETMESRKCSGLSFAGEVMDIDGITGGFNFQAAWTTGFIAGKLL